MAMPNANAISWPPRSSNLTPLDFFLWGYLKSEVYVDPYPRNLQELTLRITQEFNLIPQAMIARATGDGFRRRLNKMVVARGCHFEY